MRYYDTVETPKTGKTFKSSGINRIPETDERVEVWFKPIDNVKFDRAFDSEGLPILKEYELTVEGERFPEYLSSPNENGKYIHDETKCLEVLRKNKYDEIYIAFVNQFKIGEINVTGATDINNMPIDDFIVDCRRYEEKHDLDNVRTLIDDHIENNQPLEPFKIKNNEYRHLNLEGMKKVKNAMMKFGKDLYKNKFQKDFAIKQATTKEELNSIKW